MCKQLDVKINHFQTMDLLVLRMSVRIWNMGKWKFTLKLSKISTGKGAASALGLAVLMKKSAGTDYRRQCN